MEPPEELATEFIKPPPLKPPAPKDDTSRTDRLVESLDNGMRYIPDWKSWVYWDGERWSKESGDYEIHQRIAELQAALMEEANTTVGQTEQKEAFSVAMAARSKKAIDAMIALTKTRVGVKANTTEFDSNPWLFGVANGAIELKTGQFRATKKEDLILNKSPISFDASAKCPQWLEFLEQILPAQELRDFIQRMIGYSMTTMTTEQVLFFLYGTGMNGKSTFMEVVEKIFGDYAWHTNASLFLADKFNSDHSPAIASLVEKRLVVGAEVPTSARINENIIKDLTGSDILNARKLYCEAFQFKPTHKLFFVGNHKPTIKGTDTGMWRRMRLIPFTVQIPEEKRDTGIVERLRLENAGILNWAIEGCLKWQKEGLGNPPCVKDATDSYREDEDIIGEFITEECKMEGDVFKDDLFRAFDLWCQARGHRYVQGTKAVAERMRSAPGVGEGRKKHKGIARRFWSGISLTDPKAFKGIN
jgi:putative DNA primase/helicase